MKKKLDEIIEFKKKEIILLKQKTPIAKLEKQDNFYRQTLSINKSLENKNNIGIIAEFKKQSPSKGIINSTAIAKDTIDKYSKNGASAVSILTDINFFGGKYEDIILSRQIEIPILRKDFIIDEYQIYESKALGADCILLIANCLEKKQINDLTNLAKSLKLEVLLELHEEKDLEKINDNIDIIGINNRNLQTFIVNIEHSIKMINKIPKKFTSIAESGINSMKELLILKKEGFKGFLIGEKFMQDEDPGEALKLFINQI